MRSICAEIVRAVLLAGGIFIHYMERLADWFIGYGGKTEYIRKGSCKRCGRCCQVLAIGYPNFFNRLPMLLDTVIKWHELRYGFSYLNREQNYLLYKCNFMALDGTCRRYHFRPRLCREYPKIVLYGRPHIHFSCGYHVVRRDGRITFDNVLHDTYEKQKA